jgi:hypothetical protein
MPDAEARSAEARAISGLSLWIRFGTTVRRIADRLHSKESTLKKGATSPMHV